MNRPVKQRHTGTRIYERLRNEHGDIFNACERTVRAYVAAKKEKGTLRRKRRLSSPGTSAR